MAVAIYEFPLCEKVRNYLRLEQLFKQLKQVESAKSDLQYLHFFKVLFDLIDLIERLDLRTDFIRDIEAQKKNLNHWAEHPDIDSAALELTVKGLNDLSASIKNSKKLGAKIREEKFLSSIRQRFSIPGGATSFDLPGLFYWLKQDQKYKTQCVKKWIGHLSVFDHTIQTLLEFLRARSQFSKVVGENGFYQGIVEDKLELIRLKCEHQLGCYPVVSGNKYRYGIKFMLPENEEQHAQPVAESIDFEIACC